MNPEAGVTVRTDPLDQGISHAVGMVMAESHLAAVYNKPNFTVFDNYTNCFYDDGCLMEGVSGEPNSIENTLEFR